MEAAVEDELLLEGQEEQGDAILCHCAPGQGWSVELYKDMKVFEVRWWQGVTFLCR